MIPKKIHYCWFGGKKLPKEVLKCIESWKKYCPDYEIIEWNESNYDINKNDYVKEAYKNKKWAFLTDYVRLDIIYNYGGIYLDTDVELIKKIDDLLVNDAFMGTEQIGKVATGLGFGAIKHHPFIKENKEYYENGFFVDEHGKVKFSICVSITTNLLKKHGFEKKDVIQVLPDANIIIYPVEYFCPLKMGTNKLTITNKTYSIHHYDGTWQSDNKIFRKIKYYLIPLKQFLKKVVKKNE